MKGYVDQQVPFTFPQVSGGSTGSGMGLRVWAAPARSPALIRSSRSRRRAMRAPGAGLRRALGRAPWSRAYCRRRIRKVRVGGAGGGGWGRLWAGAGSSPCASAPTSPSRPASPRWSIPLSLPRAPLKKPLAFRADLFQDLSQFQETWLTEGRLLPLALFWFLRLSLLCLFGVCTVPLLCLPSSKH